MATVGSLAVVLTASATDFERTMGRAARAVKSTEKEFMQSARRMEDIGRKWTLGVTGPIIAGLTVISKGAIQWEDDIAGVRKTVKASEAQFAALEKSLRKTTKDIPLFHTEIAGIAESAGQLGIQVSNIEDFTRTMAMMGTATRLTSEEAAIALAQMDNIMRSGQKSFDRYGAVVVELGNNLATTGEQSIVDFGLRIAGTGRIAKLTEAEVLAIGGAFASVGVEAEAGGTAVNKVLVGMTEAVAMGNKHLKWYAATAGMSATEFASAWREDSGEAFTRFVEGLGRSGDQAFAILRNLGLSDQRLIRGFLSVAGAGDLLRRSMDMSTAAWEENTALTKEANERYKTFKSGLILLRNRIYDVGITIGKALAPLREILLGKANRIVSALEGLANGFAKLPAPIRTTVGSMLLLIAAIGPVMLAIALLNRIIAAAIAIWGMLAARAAVVSFAFIAWRGGAAKLGEALSYIVGGPIKLAILAITAAAIAAISLAANWEKVSRLAVAAWSVIGAAAMYGASLVVRGVGIILSAFAVIIPPLRGVAQAVIGVADGLKASAGSALAAAKSVSSASGVAQQAAESQNGIAKAGQNAADSQDELAKATEGAGKAAAGSLQGFDEINQLQSNMASAAPALPEIADVPELPAVPLLGSGIGDIAGSMGDQISSIADKASGAWNRLKQAMEPVNKAVQWIKDNWPTIGPIVEGIASVIAVLLVPALIKAGVEATIAGAKAVAAWISQGIAAVAHGAVVVGQLLLAGAKWVWYGIVAMANGIRAVAAWAMQGIAAAVSVAGQVAHIIFLGAKWIWIGAVALANAARMAAAWFIALGPVAWVTAAVVGLAILIIANWDWIKEKTKEIWDKIMEHMINPIKDAYADLVGRLKQIKDDVLNTWDSILKKIMDLKTSLHNSIVEPFSNAYGDLTERIGQIKGDIISTWDAILQKITGLKSPLYSNIVEPFINAKNAIINPIQSAKLTLMGIINSIQTAFANMKITIPQPKLPHVSVSTRYKSVGNISIPYPDFDVDWRAQGGVFNSPTVIGVGEAGAEAVMPLERNTGWIDQLAEKLATALGGGQGAGGDIYVYIGNEQVDAYIRRSNDRRGSRSNGR